MATCVVTPQARSSASARRVEGGGGGYLADDGAQDRSLAYQRLVRELLEAQRHEIVRLRNRGEISNQVMHRIRPADDSFL